MLEISIISSIMAREYTTQRGCTRAESTSQPVMGKQDFLNRLGRRTNGVTGCQRKITAKSIFVVTVTALVSRRCSFSFLSIPPLLLLGPFLLSRHRCQNAAATKVFCCFSFRQVQNSSRLRAKKRNNAVIPRFSLSLWPWTRHNQRSTHENQIRGSVLGMRSRRELRSPTDHPEMREQRTEQLRVLVRSLLRLPVRSSA